MAVELSHHLITWAAYGGSESQNADGLFLVVVVVVVVVGVTLSGDCAVQPFYVTDLYRKNGRRLPSLFV